MTSADSEIISQVIQKTRRVVIKIGSSILVDPRERVSEKILSGLASDLAFIRKQKIQTVVVSSGAIASGMRYLGFEKKPHRISELQACAAIGQPLLMKMYQKALARSKVPVAQILLTRADLTDRTRYLNAKHTLLELLQRDALPIINENDTVITDEIRVGDNDNLASLVTTLIDADLLILLTDQDGFYTADPRQDPAAIRIPVVENIDQATLSRAANTSLATSVGGMLTKLEAAKKAGQFGIPTIIASGKTPGTLKNIFQGKSVGTIFLSSVDSLQARKHWIAHTLKPQGVLHVDAGARKALIDGKKSLLPSGIIKLEGTFRQGDSVDITENGIPFARGLIAYGFQDLEKICGKKSAQIEPLLGYKGPDEAIHRNDLVIL